MSDSEKGVRIVIGSTADTAGFEKTDAAIHKTGEELDRCKEKGKEFLDTFKMGVGINIGERVVEGIAEIPNLIREATEEGVKFIAFTETSANALAGAMRSVNPSLTWEQAKKEGGEALDDLRKKANDLGIDFESMVETFKVNEPTLAKAGIDTLQKQIDTITLLNQVAAAKGIQGFQAQRDIMDILNGNGSRTMLGRELEANGITNQSIKQAEQMGTLYDMLREKLGAYAEAGVAAAKTLNGEEATFHNELQQMLGELAEPSFDGLKEGIAQLNEELKDPAAAAALKSLGYEIAKIVDDGVALTEWAIKNADALGQVARGAGMLAVAFAAMKIKDIAIGLAAMTLDLGRNTTALEAETVALGENTVAQEANAAGRAANGAAAAGGILSKGGGLLMGALNPIIAGAAIGGGLAEWQNTPSADDVAHMDEAGRLGALWRGRKQQLAGLSSPEEKQQFQKQLQQDLLDLAKQRNGADVQSAALIDAAAHQLQKYLEASRQISDEKLRQLGLAKQQHEEETKARSLQQQGTENANVLKGLEGGITKATELDRAREASQTGDLNGVRREMSAVAEQLNAARAAFLHPSAQMSDKDQKAAAQEIVKLEATLLELGKTRDAAQKKSDADAEAQGKKNDEAAMKQLERQKALVEELGKERIAQVEAAGGKEEDIARKRKAIEDDVAAQRLALDDRMGVLKGETPDERASRHEIAQAQQGERDAALAKVHREAQQKKDKSVWDKGLLPGRIDGRTQHVVGENGDLLETHGVAKYGRDAMGGVNEPSMLDAMTGPGWSGQARRTFADLVPPARTATPAQPQGAQQQTQAAQQAKTALDGTSKSMAEIAKAADGLAKSSGAAGKEVTTALQAAEIENGALVAAVKEYARTTSEQIKELTMELHNLSGRQANSRS